MGNSIGQWSDGPTDADANMRKLQQYSLTMRVVGPIVIHIPFPVRIFSRVNLVRGRLHHQRFSKRVAIGFDNGGLIKAIVIPLGVDFKEYVYEPKTMPRRPLTH